jgi:hypothetical protein
MKILKEVSFAEVLNRFRVDHAVDRNHASNTNRDAEEGLQRADQLLGRWLRITLDMKEVRGVILPWHLSEGGALPLIPKTGLTVEQAVERLQEMRADYPTKSPICWAKLERMRGASRTPVYLTTRAIDTRHYEGLTIREGLIHLDGLHRMVSWIAHEPMEGADGLEVYLSHSAEDLSSFRDTSR